MFYIHICVKSQTYSYVNIYCTHYDLVEMAILQQVNLVCDRMLEYGPDFVGLLLAQIELGTQFGDAQPAE